LIADMTPYGALTGTLPSALAYHPPDTDKSKKIQVLTKKTPDVALSCKAGCYFYSVALIPAR